ncbi:MAG: GatB/YqeY domain-containing protein [Microgenomates group bacterium]
MKLEEKIRTDLNKALKEKDRLKIATLRFLLAEIHNFWMEKQKELSDEDIISVIRRQVKLRREAIEAYKKASRNDLAEKESKELEILSKYLPQEMPAGELEKLVKETIAETGAVGLKDFGKVMGMVMAKIKGRAEGSEVSQIVKKQLAISN